MEMYLNLSLDNLVVNGEVEIWKQVNTIDGLEMFKDYYWVSSFGRVKSTRGNEKILKQGKAGRGYLRVELRTVDGKSKMMLAHRLVGLAFVEGHSEERNTVDHIFPNTKNNMASNLQWLSSGDNTRKEQSMPVIGECLKTGNVVYFESTREAGRCGFYQGNVSDCCNGKRKTHKGYRWRFKESA